MKKGRLFLSLLLGCLLCACSSIDYSSRKKVTQGIDYSRYYGNEAYYEFSSDFPPVTPTVTTDEEETQTEEPLGEDEDFTSEELASTYGNYGDVVATVATKKFELGASAGRKEMAVFQKALDAAYTKALRAYRPTGFTYSMASVGAVNPLATIQVRCMMGESSADEIGQATCTLFYNELVSNYKKLSQEAK